MIFSARARSESLLSPYFRSASRVPCCAVDSSTRSGSFLRDELEERIRSREQRNETIVVRQFRNLRFDQFTLHKRREFQPRQLAQQAQSLAISKGIVMFCQAGTGDAFGHLFDEGDDCQRKLLAGSPTTLFEQPYYPRAISGI
jgi:hypothetical protein